MLNNVIFCLFLKSYISRIYCLSSTKIDDIEHLFFVLRHILYAKDSYKYTIQQPACNIVLTGLVEQCTMGSVLFSVQFVYNYIICVQFVHLFTYGSLSSHYNDPKIGSLHSISYKFYYNKI